MADILIKNGRVFDGESFLPNNTSILIDNGRISCIGDNLTDGANFEIDASGMTVLPGLVDAHIHIKGISSDEFGVIPTLGTYPYGVTAAADAGSGQGDMTLMKQLSLKSRVFVSVPIRGNSPDLTMLEARLKAFGEYAVGLKVYFDTRQAKVTDIRPLAEVVRFADAVGTKVMVHTSNSPTSMFEIADTLRRGDIITHAYHGGENNASLDGFECLRHAKSRGVWVDVGMAGHVHTDFNILAQAIAADAAPDIISTDLTRYSMAKRGGNYGMTLCMSIARSCGMSEVDILRASTLTPSTALGMDESCGRLCVGRCADVAAFKWVGGSACDATRELKCMWTIADGDIVFRR